MFVAAWLKHLVGVGPIRNQEQILVHTDETVIKQVESAWGMIVPTGETVMKQFESAWNRTVPTGETDETGWISMKLDRFHGETDETGWISMKQTVPTGETVMKQVGSSWHRMNQRDEPVMKHVD